jgi:hypothetical protein
MSFEEVPTNIPRPIENPDLSTDIDAEMFTLAEEAGKLEQEIKTLQTEAVNDNIDEEKKADIFSQTRKITYAVAALLAIPLAAGVFKPEKAREINEAMSKLVNNNIPEMLTIFGVMLGAVTIYAVREEIQTNKKRARCRKIFETMLEKTQINNLDDLDADLEYLMEQFKDGVFLSREAEKKSFREQLSTVKEKLELHPELAKDGALLKLNNLISELRYY